jgi:hypothetical protein
MIEIKPIICDKCNFNYCPCCEEKCPKCGEDNDKNIDDESLFFIKQMRENR